MNHALSGALAEARGQALDAAGVLGPCLAACEQRGDWYVAASLERALEYLGESVRILDKVIEGQANE